MARGELPYKVKELPKKPYDRSKGGSEVAESRLPCPQNVGDDVDPQGLTDKGPAKGRNHPPHNLRRLSSPMIPFFDQKARILGFSFLLLVSDPISSPSALVHKTGLAISLQEFYKVGLECYGYWKKYGNLF
ncbi:unnamed protein product [Vicia faba]|uniref:Uncharacterized protein n=1 Tax=Vicia faba TaxID=3906 RepID=A0AAV0YKV9_VICFA|nr:unnamed protein product [Vicia faba]